MNSRIDPDSQSSETNWVVHPMFGAVLYLAKWGVKNNIPLTPTPPANHSFWTRRRMPQRSAENGGRHERALMVGGTMGDAVSLRSSP